MRNIVYIVIMLLLSVAWALVGNFTASSAFVAGVFIVSALSKEGE